MNIWQHVNFNRLYRPILETVLREGTPASPRGQDTHEVLGAVIELSEPRERVCTVPGRRPNPFFQWAETVWILHGSRDADWIRYFNDQMGSYLDPDGTAWGAYGHRMRYAAGRDQLAAASNTLAHDMQSRRAVISLWHPFMDTEPGHADYPCLAGDTILWSPEGDRPIEEVASLFKTGQITRWPVYAVDETNAKLCIAWATKVWQQTELRRTVKVTFDDGSAIRVTPDHVLYRKPRRGWQNQTARWRDCRPLACPAIDLKPGDRVVAVSRLKGPKGHEFIKRVVNKNTAFTNQQATHRSYSELLNGPVPKGWDVHHDNDVKLDNRAENLVRMPHGDHAALKMFGDKNPHRRMTVKEKAKRGKKHSKALRTYWRDVRAGYRDRENHVVVSVEACGPEVVYDFAVPGFHTAIVGTGVLAHNCNTEVLFKAREGHLHATVINRSNDLHLGLAFTNITQFTTLMEVLAADLGLHLGLYRHYSDSLHVYDASPITAQLTDHPLGFFDVYEHVPPTPLAKLMSLEQTYRDIGTLYWLVEGMQTQGARTAAVHLVERLVSPYWRACGWALVAWGLLQHDREGAATGETMQTLGRMLPHCQDWYVACVDFALRRWERTAPTVVRDRTLQAARGLERYELPKASIEAICRYWETH